MCYLLQLVLKTKWYSIMCAVCTVLRFYGTFIHNFYYSSSARFFPFVYVCVSGCFSVCAAQSVCNFRSYLTLQCHLFAHIMNKYIVKRFWNIQRSAPWQSVWKKRERDRSRRQGIIFTFSRFRFWLFYCFIVKRFSLHAPSRMYPAAIATHIERGDRDCI